jgi:acyl-CoA synthetase (AMP-forming)/AMP-acid ligase II
MGQIGEIIVQGPPVTREYLNSPEANALAKIADTRPGDSMPSVNGDAVPAPFWHRIGDVGYFDERGRLWYCGRKSQVVRTAQGTMYTEQCEAIFHEHPRVFRSALVGLGAPGGQTPAIIVEPDRGQFPLLPGDRRKFLAELHQLASANPLTLDIRHILFHRSLPVDARHNAKINREQLALWAANALHGKI